MSCKYLCARIFMCTRYAKRIWVGVITSHTQSTYLRLFPNALKKILLVLGSNKRRLKLSSPQNFIGPIPDQSKKLKYIAHKIGMIINIVYKIKPGAINPTYGFKVFFFILNIIPFRMESVSDCSPDDRKGKKRNASFLPKHLLYILFCFNTQSMTIDIYCIISANVSASSCAVMLPARNFTASSSNT